MAVTVIPDLIVISDCESNADWTLGDADADAAIQGTNCLGEQVKTTTSVVYEYDITTGLGAAIDISNGEHIYVWMLCNGVVDTKAAGGYRIYLESTTGNDSTWYVGGNDTLPTGWNNIVLDPSSVATTINGTLDLTNINVFGVQFKTLTTVVGQANNVFWDVARYGKGLIATGTSFTLQDIATEDDATANKYGILQEIDGVLFSQGAITIGDGTNTAELNSENEVLAFRDREVDTDLYALTFTGASTNVTAQTLTILSAGDSGFTRPDILVDTSTTGFTMDGCNIRRTGVVTFHDDCEITNSVFTDCGTISPALSIFQSNTIANSDSIRAVEMDQQMSGATAGNFANNSFLNNYSAATWYAFGGTYTDYSNTYTGNLYDVENSSADALTINLDGTSNASAKYENTGIITFVSTTNFELTDLQPDTEVRIFTSGTTEDYTTVGDEIYGIESATGSTTFQYGQDVITSGNNCIVMIHSIQYETIRFTTDLLGTDTSIPIQQQFDRNYKNP
jgi:hypothetical protein